MKYRPRIRSRHPTHDVLRRGLPPQPVRCVIRLGSLTPSNAPVQINSVEAIQHSWDKLLMKQCFKRAEVKTAAWNWGDYGDLKFPIVAKHRMSSRGQGVYRFKTKEEFLAWKEENNPDLTKFIFEKFHNYGREYRLHVTESGCFYTCRKLRKNGTPGDQRWKFNVSQGAEVWVMDTNPQFDKPEFWDQMVSESVKALKSVGLDVGAVDVKCSKEDFFILEINSAPSFGQITSQKYMEILPIVIQNKIHANSTVH